MSGIHDWRATHLLTTRIDDEGAARTSTPGDAASARARTGAATAANRSYAERAQNLAVFCISSRAYQQFRGRRAHGSGHDADGGDGNGDGGRLLGYRTVDETEIPGLQQHARQLGAARWLERDRKTLQALVQLLTSLSVWVTSSAGGLGLQVHIDQERREYELQQLDQAHDELKHVSRRGMDGVSCPFINLR